MSRAAARTELRPATVDDAAALAALARDNRDFLAPFEPHRDPAHFTEAGQRDLLVHLLAEHEQGRVVPFVIVHEGDLVGRLTLNDVVRGPAQWASLGYFVAEAVNGRGVASEAVAQVLVTAFAPREDGGLGLHRLQAGTLLSNYASQAVLRRNGFERIGVARRYLRIAGAWQDHVLHQRTA